MVKSVRVLLFLVFVAPCGALAGGGQAVAPAYKETVARVREMVQREIDRGLLKGVSVAIVDDQKLVWAGGMGLADVKRKIPARADTVYRVGSISKLFTAIGVMILSERGKLDIDAPLTRYYPEFTIGRDRFPNARPTTLRQIMTHRSGFPRESPVGSYFDGTEPGLEKTVRSLAECQLVNEPESTTKYSNAAVALEGYVAARVAGAAFQEFEQDALLGPLAMTSSSFRVTARVREKLAAAYMKLASGREIVAPTFELGTVPAGNLYASVEDMARFISFLLARGRVGPRRILRPETLREMFRVQYAGKDAKSGFGLGFYSGEIDGRRWVGHGGAVYGFSSQIALFPEEKLGVMVCANQDVVNAAVGAVARRALQWMVAAREETTGPALPRYTSLPAADLKRMAGAFRTRAAWLDVSLSGAGLEAARPGQWLDLRPTAPRSFLAYGGSHYEAPLVFAEDLASFTLAGRRYERVAASPARSETPSAWKEYVGVYGPEFIPTVLMVHDGKFVAVVENAFAYEMAPDGRDAFRFPAGLYEQERLVILRDAGGAVAGLKIGHVRFSRRHPERAGAR